MTDATENLTFQDFDLPEEILGGLRRKGFKAPTPIQAMVIPEVAKGRDLIVQAQTGSGKTLAFGLPILKQEPVDQRAPGTLIITPTRELAKQIRVELMSVLGTFDRRVVSITGGDQIEKQIEQLKLGAHVVVGTPGRLAELLERNALNLKHARQLVLDEADELLARGFEKELSALIARMPKVHQTLLFSATMPSAVQRLADANLKKPHRIKVSAAPETPLEIKHFTLDVTESTRFSALVAWLNAERPFMTLVFCRTRTETEWLSEQLGMKGLENEYLSGELSQAKRNRILASFRTGDLPLLIATDLASRGIDVPGITHVVNYTVPTATETYVHRTGRTGRAGREGVALTLVAPGERKYLSDLQKIAALKPWRGIVVEDLPQTKMAPARKPSSSLRANRTPKRGSAPPKGRR